MARAVSMSRRCDISKSDAEIAASAVTVASAPRYTHPRFFLADLISLTPVGLGWISH